MGMAVLLSACGMEKEAAEATEASNAAGVSESAETAEGNEEESEKEAAASEAAEDAAVQETSGQTQDHGELSDTVVLEGDTVSTPYFTARIPASWEDGYQWKASEFEDGYSLSFEDTEAVESCGSGNLCSIQVSPEPPVYIQYIGGDFVGVIRNADTEETRYVSVSYPTEAPFEGEILDHYLEMAEDTASLRNSIQAAEGWEMLNTTYEEAMADVENSVSGVMADASMHSFTLLSYTGSVVTFSGADLDIANLTEDGVHPGHCYEVTYKGVIGDDGNTENATFVSLENRDDSVPQKDYDACYTAAQVVLAFRAQSMDYLAGLCRFPITLDGTSIESAEALTALDFNETFSEDLIRNVSYCELYHTEITGDSFSISLLQKAPEVVIEKVGEGWWAVTAINNK